MDCVTDYGRQDFLKIILDRKKESDKMNIEKLKAVINELEETPVYTSKPRRMLQEIIAEAEQKPDVLEALVEIAESQDIEYSKCKARKTLIELGYERRLTKQTYRDRIYARMQNLRGKRGCNRNRWRN